MNVQATPRTSFARTLLAALPTALVLGFLVGVAVLGHFTDWSPAKVGAFFKKTANAEPEDWCKKHSVPESICVECRPELAPRTPTTWCKTHGVHYCPLETLAAAQLTPADRKKITQDDLLAWKAAADAALALKPRTENDKNCKLHLRRIQLASEAVMSKMGLDGEPAERGSVEETIAVSGEIGYEQPKVTPASSPVAGRVWHLTEKAAVGAQVKRGDVLALVDAVDVGKAKSELLQAYAQLELRKRMLDHVRPLTPGIYGENKLIEADVAHREGQIRVLAALQALSNFGLPLTLDEKKPAALEELSARVQFLGIPVDLLQGLSPRPTTSNLLPVLAPQDGVVIDASATRSGAVDAGKSLFVVADTSRMWINLSARALDVRYLRIRDPKTGAPGQTVRFRIDGFDQPVVGELVWKSTRVDDKTRTVDYRAEVANPDGTLLAHSYGKGEVVIRQEKNAIVVPNEAVHWEKNCHVVFVRDNGFYNPESLFVFHVRSVRVGVTNGNQTEILAGLLPGEWVVTKNSTALRAEMLKNTLGDG